MKTPIRARLELLDAVLRLQERKLKNAIAHRWHKRAEAIKRRQYHVRMMIQELESR